MPLTINGKVFLNLQEAVAWLLANNALPFQSTANFVANTEIAKTTIINPSPAEIKIGSLVLFADGKVGTVSGITASGFMVGTDATDLSDGVPHITGIALDASNHLIFTMSEGSPKDAGLVKMVSSLTIDASQHLIANYNDGTSTDLGSIFQGNVNIAGNFTADSIVENMTGYSYDKSARSASVNYNDVYSGVVKNGNKLTFVIALEITTLTAINEFRIGSFGIPSAVGAKLYPSTIAGLSMLSVKEIKCHKTNTQLDPAGATYYVQKVDNSNIAISMWFNGFTANETYYVRIEETFLLSDNLGA